MTRGTAGERARGSVCRSDSGATAQPLFRRGPCLHLPSLLSHLLCRHHVNAQRPAARTRGAANLTGGGHLAENDCRAHSADGWENRPAEACAGQTELRVRGGSGGSRCAITRRRSPGYVTAHLTADMVARPGDAGGGGVPSRCHGRVFNLVASPSGPARRGAGLLGLVIDSDPARSPLSADSESPG